MEGPSRPPAERVIRRCQLLVLLLFLSSLTMLLGGAAVVGKIGPWEFFLRISSARVSILLALFLVIYIPAILRIYYILLLNAKGVFNVSDRRRFNEGKQKWEKRLVKAALLSGSLLILFAIGVRLSR